MRKVILYLAAMLLFVGFYSCTLNRHSDFSKIKYLEKYGAKQHQDDKKPAEFFLESNSENPRINVLKYCDAEASVNEGLLLETGLKNMPLVMAGNGKKDSLSKNSLVDNRINVKDIFANLKHTGSKKSIYNFSPYAEIIVEDKKNYLIFKILLCLVLPPLAVYWHRGISNYFWVSLILLLPGFPFVIIYSLLVVLDVIVYKEDKGK